MRTTMFTDKVRRVLRAIHQYVENSASLESVSAALSRLKEEDVLSTNEQGTTLYFFLIYTIVQTKKEEMLWVWDEFWKYHLLLDYPAIKHSLTKYNLEKNPTEYIVFSLYSCTTPEQQKILLILFEQHLMLIKYCSNLESNQASALHDQNLMLRMAPIHNKILFLAVPPSLLELYFKEVLRNIAENFSLNNTEPLNHFKQSLLFESKHNFFSIYGQLLNHKVSLEQLNVFLNILRTLRAQNWITTEEYASYLLGQNLRGYSALHIAIMENNFEKIKRSIEEIRLVCSTEQVKEALLYKNTKLGRTVIQQGINNGNYKYNNIACIKTAQYFIEIVASTLAIFS